MCEKEREREGGRERERERESEQEALSGKKKLKELYVCGGSTFRLVTRRN